ncbi:MAG: hypothetical protein WBL27_01615 [Salinimicrobium sp.]
MRNLKLMLVALVISLSSTIYANNRKFVNTDSLSVEIERTLDQYNCDVQEDLTVTVFFSVSEDGRIQSLTVASGDEKMNNLLQDKLEGQEVPGDFWRKGKIYELTVVQQARK